MTTRKDIASAYQAMMAAVKAEREAVVELKAELHSEAVKAFAVYVELKAHCWE